MIPTLDASFADEALQLLQDLIRLDTTNPPGNESRAALRCAEELRKDGLEPELVASVPGRDNLICRWKGTGAKPPLMLTAHLDVVPAGDGWKHPPFGAELHDGYVWGRGAVDMKNHAAASLTILRALARSGVRLSRDVLLVLVADEEAGCEHGADFLVTHHADKVKAELALGEIGGFTLHMDGKRFYPIQAAHRGVRWMKARTRGEAGHGSMPRDETAVTKLAEALARLGRTRLPLHPPAVTREFVKTIAKELGFPKSVALSALLSPTLGPKLLAKLPDRALARSLGAVLGNTATANLVRAGEKINSIPSVAEAELDGRTVPGPDGELLLAELQAVLGPEVELETTKTMPALEVPFDNDVFRTLSECIRRGDPDGIPVPYMMMGFTDGWAFAKNGTLFYGFNPLQLPPEIKFAELYHNANERIPVDGFKWGVRVLWDAVHSLAA